jgi:uncharacterized protein YabN with tetrapyrrole methylase and pyrophosphatase domain
LASGVVYLQQQDTDKLKDELGVLLFSVVNVARLLGTDAEQALGFNDLKFFSRF